MSYRRLVLTLRFEPTWIEAAAEVVAPADAELALASNNVVGIVKEEEKSGDHEGRSERKGH